MSLLVVGSVALDTIETPWGRAQETLGGAATYFSAAASLLHPVALVGVVGTDFPLDALDFLVERGVDLAGVEQADGESFRWVGAYDYDLNAAHTIETRLGVFAEFRPTIPARFREAEWVFLANIAPELQLEVLDQVRAPRLVACDTMNYWIEQRRAPLLELLERVDVLMVNDAEIRQLSGEPNLQRAARWVQQRGPECVVVKKGEHGAILYTGDQIFCAPCFPLEQVLDPTGAGDSFAGGFMGYLAQADSTTAEEMRRAIVYGSALGSFAVECFGVDRLTALTVAEVHERVRVFKDITDFEHPVATPPHV